MRKLIEGLLEFRRTARPEARARFAALALGQAPDALFIACSDSRVVPNLMVSTDPGDLFLMRNVGNLIPPASNASGLGHGDVSEAAAVEYAILALNVSNIIVCGHSECGAMRAALKGDSVPGAPNIDEWLKHARPALDRFRSGEVLDRSIPAHNQLSQLNVLTQIEHLFTYPCVQDAVEKGKVAVHGWYFDIAHADVHAYEKAENRFVLLDEVEAERLMARMK